MGLNIKKMKKGDIISSSSMPINLSLKNYIPIANNIFNLTESDTKMILSNMNIGLSFKGTYNSLEDVDIKNIIDGDMVCAKGKLYCYSSGYWFNVSISNNEDEVIKFINKFKSKNDIALEDSFLNGNCYWFARILAERFNGEIYVNQIINHFATKINNNLYDITGLIDSKNFESWNEYKKKEPEDSARIYRDCILKLDSDEIDYANNTCNGIELKIYNVEV